MLVPRPVWALTFTALLTVIFLLLRCLARHIKKQRIWWDDILITAAIVCFLGVLGVDTAMVRIGLGKHVYDLPQSSVITINKLLLASDLLYISTISFTKLGVLLMQYRIFDVATNFKRWVVGISILVAVWFVVFFFLLTFTCVPVRKRWDMSVPGHCTSRVPGTVACAGTNIAGEVIILILPIPQIWKLQLRMCEKILLTFIFGFGLFVISTSVVRLLVFLRHEVSSSDITYNLLWVVGWSDIEMSTGIICACLPTLRPVALRIKRAMSTSPFIYFRQRSSTMNNQDGDVAHTTYNSAGSHYRQHSSDGNQQSRGGACSTWAGRAATVSRQTSHDRLYNVGNDDLSNTSEEVVSLENISTNSESFKDGGVRTAV